MIATFQQIARQFEACFPERLPGPRTVGREAEYPVVTADGQAGDGRRVFQALQATDGFRASTDSGNPDLVVRLDGPGYSYTLEVGLGTIEVNTGPCPHLFQLQEQHRRAVQRLRQACQALGYRLLGYGIQPLTPPSRALMTPKQRYQVLHQAMGESWLWYTITASDQLQVDIARPELVHMVNYGNLITPVVIALCANSPVYAGRESGLCSAREGRMLAIYSEEQRHGMIRRPFRDMTDYVATMSQSLCFMLREGERYRVYNRPFTEYLAEHGPDFDAFLFHEHYIWNSARARTAYGTLELRSACQQPWDEHMAAAALYLGLVEAADQVTSYLEGLFGAELWPRMHAYHRQAIATGLAGPEPVSGFLAQLLTLAQRALERRGWGEESLLRPLFRSLAARENPAQRILARFRSQGLAGLLDATAL